MIESCFHMCHIQCLVKSAILRQSRNWNVTCPKKGCDAEVPVYQINELMSQQDKDKVEKAQLALTMEQIEGMVACPDPMCGNFWQFVPGQVDYNQKDDKG